MPITKRNPASTCANCAYIETRKENFIEQSRCIFDFPFRNGTNVMPEDFCGKHPDFILLEARPAMMFGDGSPEAFMPLKR